MTWPVTNPQVKPMDHLGEQCPCQALAWAQEKINPRYFFSESRPTCLYPLLSLTERAEEVTDDTADNLDWSFEHNFTNVKKNWNRGCSNHINSVRGHPFRPLSIKFHCHAPLSDVGPAPHVTLRPRTISRVPRTSPHYVTLTYILCSYVPRSRLCLTADMVAWYCIVRVYTHRLS